MTDIDTALEIIDEPDEGRRLEREADAFLSANAGRRPVTSVRAAVREDAARLRHSARAASLRARERAAAHPRSSVLYAVGAGVLIGLILGR